VAALSDADRVTVAAMVAVAALKRFRGLRVGFPDMSTWTWRDRALSYKSPG
jgi:hypothetical protein